MPQRKHFFALFRFILAKGKWTLTNKRREAEKYELCHCDKFELLTVNTSSNKNLFSWVNKLQYKRRLFALTWLRFFHIQKNWQTFRQQEKSTKNNQNWNEVYRCSILYNYNNKYCEVFMRLAAKSFQILKNFFPFYVQKNEISGKKISLVNKQKENNTRKLQINFCLPFGKRRFRFE